ncbi:MAG: hypothetical protein LKH35_03000 [Companilactobacillus sp.]|uniref:hypothetical protein n=2 Tax=Companilactobacillus sp. TaxID=2767905 RepID=UPI0025BF4E0B|nr:hypothetical protein [Companilactobacillus sp.]MCH4008738.1 hypothetical protein [Companilactobacillus sp.]MCH4051083.1 hypothetical protein [Companilactobacillus sp.]MCH4076681.1 hypothetical protein [Companilactobacillus sp.]MCH4125256.1 hypothetical protein [Companilactobacillus sp.]MCH4131796.1 hypothetical protein [Companilactobacillus sp.]
MIESLFSLMLVTLMTATFSVVVIREYRLLKAAEHRVSELQIIADKLKNPDFPAEVTINGEKYRVESTAHSIQVTPQQGKSYEINWH